MDEPNIQRDSYSGNGTPLSGNVTKRMEAQMQAAAMGIDTKGLSTREVRTAITAKQEADKELSAFIKETIADLPRNQSPNAVQQEVMTTRTDDAPSNIASSSGKGRGGSGNMGLPIEFFVWEEGVVGKITLLAGSGFTAL